MEKEGKEPISLMKQSLSACFFGITSVLLIVINKVILTTFKFPSYLFVGLGQIITTIILLYTAKLFSVINFPDFNRDTFKKMWPLPLIYYMNLIYGLGGTQKLNLPMFTVLRRIAIWFTMLGEGWVLGIKAPWLTQACVLLMISGAFIAAVGDLAFDLEGYTFIMLNNVYNAASVIYTKQKLKAKEMDKYGLLYYNALFCLVPLLPLINFKGEFQKVIYFEAWNNMYFVFQFLLSCFMGFILMYSTMLCTHFNSALTTTIVGLLKNLVVTYAGIVIGGDYIFSWLNFTGLNISTVGSIIYTYTAFRRPDNVIYPIVLKVEGLNDQPTNSDNEGLNNNILKS